METHIFILAQAGFTFGALTLFALYQLWTLRNLNKKRDDTRH